MIENGVLVLIGVLKMHSFQGILDKLAAQSYSDAPNASTHIDHTRYSTTTTNCLSNALVALGAASSGVDVMVDKSKVYFKILFDDRVKKNWIVRGLAVPLFICSHHCLVHPREQGFSLIYCSQIPEIAAKSNGRRATR